ncbi:MAG: anaerobic nitric oxide reductase flavorubredoxin, partial [Syntrophomonadaceae bacterium]|nr:anaerobic nitric oxide reductase flavorubredoxin [Syntrophomonadaceae bacterium]
IYDTMYNATKTMAEAISRGLEKQGIKYKMFDVALADPSDLITEIFKAKAVLVGSCTINGTVLRPTAGLLEEIKAHRFRGKLGAGFGSYGWSGEAPKTISAALEGVGLTIPRPPLGFKYSLTESELEQCEEFGEAFAQAMK